MGGPDNGMYIVQGEVNLVVTAMRRVSRWSSHSHHAEEQDPLLSSFASLKHTLNRITSLHELSPNEFLGPFLEVIRSEDTTGPITGLALTSVNKFLSYSLIDVNSDTTAAAIENIADAVTHARFVGTDPASDEVVLMKILHVLRTLILTPAGAMLTNESVCEIMQSCFRICFEMRLSELLRKSAEHTLMDMVQLLFTRLPQFKEDPKWATSLKKLKMRTGGMDPSRKFKKKPSKSKHKKAPSQPHPTPSIAEDESTPGSHASNDPKTDTPVTESSLDTSTVSEDTCDGRPSVLPVYRDEDVPVVDPTAIGTTPVSPSRTLVDMQEGFKHAESEPDLQSALEDSITEDTTQPETIDHIQILHKPTASTDSGLDTASTLTVTSVDSVMEKAGSVSDVECESVHSAAEQSDSAPSQMEAEFVGPRGVRFMPPHQQQGKDGHGPLIPYGLPCVRELFRFLISLTNPHDRHNTDVMIHMGLSLLTVALESGADHIPGYNSLLSLVKDDMCKHLFFLLQSERLSLFAASIRVCYLLFEAMRSHLKFQLEMYLVRLMDLVVSDSQKISYEQREISLESMVQLLRIPGLVTELYLNYDCDLYCTNLFEDLMKLLSKNAFPMSDLYSTHLLSLEALLAVIDSIEQHCHHRILHTSARLAAQTAAEKLKGQTDEVSEANVPPSSGYTVAEKLSTSTHATDTDQKEGSVKVNILSGSRGPRIRPNRMRVSDYIPNEEELAAIKHKKKIYQTGTEQFNVKPGKGIAYLQEHSLFSTPLDQGEVVTFLRENPKKKKVPTATLR